MLNNSSFRLRRKTNYLTEINLTPLMDVLLVLLIIFMVTAPMLTTGVHIDLPEAETSAVSGDDEPLILSIDKNKYIYIQDQKVDDNKIIEKLSSILNENKDARILIRADKNLEYGFVINILAFINNAGFNKVALITENNS